MNKTSQKTIAERLGVTDATVSMALRDHPRISEKRKKQVRQIARELGYTPHPLAAGLRGGATRSLGLLWSLGDWSGAYTMRKVVNRFRSAGFVSYLSDHYSEAQRVEEYLQDLLQRGADGVVILMSEQEMFQSPDVLSLIRRFRFRLLVADEPVAFADADVVIRDRGPAVRDATEHLLRSGRRNLLFVHHDGPTVPHKIGPCLETVRQAGCGTVSVLTTTGQDLDRVLDALEHSPQARDADAMLFSNDKMALAGMRWLERAGRTCPRDVAVVGFDDTDFAPMLNPPLASVDRSSDTLAGAVGDLLNDRLTRPQDPPQERRVPMRFVWRESAGGTRPPTSPTIQEPQDLSIEGTPQPK